jgi:type I restriction enzyme M protein
MSVGNIVHSVRNIMRKDPGVDGDAQRISQMVWLIFLKVFDSMEEEKEAEDSSYKSPLPEEIRWRNWAADETGITGDELLDFVNNKVFTQIEEINAEESRKASIVKQVFEDTYNYMKNGVLMRQVINEINKIDFTKKQDRHLFNDIYETVLKELQNAGSAGEFYTPRAVTQFIVDMVNPKLGEIVLDPACGTGGFLISSLENIKKEVDNVGDLQKLGNNLRGIEKKPLPHLLCMTNLILHDIEEPNIKNDNSLSRPLRDYSSKDMVDCVVTNPPFGGAEEDGIEQNFPSGFQTRETADLFLVLIMKLLRDEGRCGLVLPESPVNEGVKARVFEKLLKEFNLHTIVRLPDGVFSPYTDINTNLLFFDKGKPTEDIWYFFHPVPEKLKHLKNPRYSKTKPITSEEFNLEKDWWNDRESEKFEKYCCKINKEKIIKRGYDLWIKNPNKEEEEEELSSKDILEKLSKSFDNSKELIEKIKGEI